jgi:hypothetical protein
MRRASVTGSSVTPAAGLTADACTGAGGPTPGSASSGKSRRTGPERAVVRRLVDFEVLVDAGRNPDEGR